MKHRVRFEFVSIAAFAADSLGASGAIRIPVKCWRATFVMRNSTRGANVGPILDGVAFAQVLSESNTIVNNASFSVGGAYDRNGEPVLIDQVLLISAPSADVPVILVLEHVEPWHE
jgi:hypothetical protein